MKNLRHGQSLVEILVAVAVGAILIVGALTIITPTLKTSSDVTRAQTAAALGKELFDNVRALSEKDWHSLDLATTSANPYRVTASTSPYTISSGTDTVQVGTTTYTRYFFLDYVYRNVNDQIDNSGTYYDPSTKKITVFYSWPSNSSSATSRASSTFISYLTRVHDEAFSQTDWSGGGSQSGVITASSVGSRFSSSSNIDYTTSSGSIVIQGF